MCDVLAAGNAAKRHEAALLCSQHTPVGLQPRLHQQGLRPVQRLCL